MTVIPQAVSAGALFDSLRSRVDEGVVELIELDSHVNDEFAARLVETLDGYMREIGAAPTDGEM